MKTFQKIDNADGPPLFKQVEIAPLFKLVTKPPREQHKFGPEKRMDPRPDLGRHQQTERMCLRCLLVKITVHPPTGGGWREWRWADAPSQFVDVVEPECIEVSA